MFLSDSHVPPGLKTSALFELKITWNDCKFKSHQKIYKILMSRLYITHKKSESFVVGLRHYFFNGSPYDSNIQLRLITY